MYGLCTPCCQQMRYLNFYFNFRFATYHLVSKYFMACSCVLFYMHSLLHTIQYNPNITCYCQDMRIKFLLKVSVVLTFSAHKVLGPFKHCVSLLSSFIRWVDNDVQIFTTISVHEMDGGCGDWGDVRVTGLLVSAAAWEDCADSGLFDPRHNTAAIICKHFAQPGRCLPGPGDSPHFCSWWRQQRILLLLSVSVSRVFIRIIYWTCKTSILQMTISRYNNLVGRHQCKERDLAWCFLHCYY